MLDMRIEQLDGETPYTWYDVEKEEIFMVAEVMENQIVPETEQDHVILTLVGLVKKLAKELNDVKHDLEQTDDNLNRWTGHNQL